MDAPCYEYMNGSQNKVELWDSLASFVVVFSLLGENGKVTKGYDGFKNTNFKSGVINLVDAWRSSTHNMDILNARFSSV